MPINPAQLTKYRHQWAAVCRANNWRQAQSRLIPGAVGAERSPWHRAVWAGGHDHASAHRRIIVPDDLRKGCHLYALRNLKSSTLFDNEDLDRILLVFAGLLDPDNLNLLRDRAAYDAYDLAKSRIAECKRLHQPCDIRLPDNPGQRIRMLHYLRAVPTHVLMAICRDKNQGAAWFEDLPFPELKQLHMTCKNRTSCNPPAISPIRPVSQSAPEPEPVFSENPF